MRVVSPPTTSQTWTIGLETKNIKITRLYLTRRRFFSLHFGLMVNTNIYM